MSNAPPRGPTPRAIKSLQPVMEALRRYHRHRVEGLEHIPSSRPAILAVHHSLATYDAFLFGYAVIQKTGRTVTGLGDNKLFALPGLRRASHSAGLLPATPENGRQLLEEGYLLGVAPGGMREALRPSTERRTVLWERRRGFVKLAMQVGVPIIPVACPAADDVYTVYENRLTKLAYKRLKFPLPVARGVGPTAIPRPVRLTTWVGPPVDVGKGDPADAEAVEAVHTRVRAAIEQLLAL